MLIFGLLQKGHRVKNLRFFKNTTFRSGLNDSLRTRKFSSTGEVKEDYAYMFLIESPAHKEITAFSDSVTTVSSKINFTNISDVNDYIILSDKPMCLIFWATTCGPCIKELEEINKIASETGSIDFFAYSKEAKNIVNTFIKKRNFTNIVFLTSNDELDEYANRIKFTPSIILTNREKIIKKILLGKQEKKELTKQFKMVLE